MTEWHATAMSAQSPSPTSSAAGRPLTVLVVDDDPDMQRMVSDYLSGNNVRVAVAANRHEMLEHLAGHEYSLVVLDLRLGSEEGFDLLRELRTTSEIPVIIMTGHHRDEIDRVVGLELGADDYIAKPFSLRELLARIRAVLRRSEAGRSRAATESARDTGAVVVRFGPWTLDRRARRLTDQAGSVIALTKGEYALLSAFIDAPQRPLSREHLLQATRVHEDVFDRSIDVQILRLRRKLKVEVGSQSVISTERGVGYVFTLPVTQA